MNILTPTEIRIQIGWAIKTAVSSMGKDDLDWRNMESEIMCRARNLLNMHNKLSDEIRNAQQPVCVICGGRQIAGGKGINEHGVCKPCEIAARSKRADW